MDRQRASLRLILTEDRTRNTGTVSIETVTRNRLRHWKSNKQTGRQAGRQAGRPADRLSMRVTETDELFED